YSPRQFSGLLPNRSTVPRGRCRCRGKCNPMPTTLMVLVARLLGVGSASGSRLSGSGAPTGGRSPELGEAAWRSREKLSLCFDPIGFYRRTGFLSQLGLRPAAGAPDSCLPNSPAIVDETLKVGRVK